MHGIDEMKEEIIELLRSIDKEKLDLCSLKEYAEVVKIVSEIKGQDYVEILAEMVSGNQYSGKGSMKALGSPMRIKDMKEHRKEEEDDD